MREKDGWFGKYEIERERFEICRFEVYFGEIFEDEDEGFVVMRILIWCEDLEV